MVNTLIKTKENRIFEYQRAVVLGYLYQIGKTTIEPLGIENDKINKKEHELNAIGVCEEQFLKIINKSKTPRLYVNVGRITRVLFIFGILCMFLDYCFSLTKLQCSTYLVWCCCCLSLYYTNKVAFEDWKVKHGRKETKWFN